MKHERLWQGYGANVTAVALLIASVLLTVAVQGGPPGQGQSGSESSGQASTASSASESSSSGANPVSTVPGDEMRAVWAPYVSLAVDAEMDQSRAAFQRKFDAIMANTKSKGMNIPIIHVHPFDDALYQSDYFPWSYILTGVQGVNPRYDPLTYMMQATHKASLKVHAWVNPLRIRTNNTSTALTQNNPYNKWQLQKLSR